MSEAARGGWLQQPNKKEAAVAGGGWPAAGSRPARSPFELYSTNSGVPAEAWTACSTADLSRRRGLFPSCSWAAFLKWEDILNWFQQAGESTFLLTCRSSGSRSRPSGGGSQTASEQRGSLRAWRTALQIFCQQSSFRAYIRPSERGRSAPC